MNRQKLYEQLSEEHSLVIESINKAASAGDNSSLFHLMKILGEIQDEKMKVLNYYVAKMKACRHIFLRINPQKNECIRFKCLKGCGCDNVQMPQVNDTISSAFEYYILSEKSKSENIYMDLNEFYSDLFEFKKYLINNPKLTEEDTILFYEMFPQISKEEDLAREAMVTCINNAYSPQLTKKP